MSGRRSQPDGGPLASEWMKNLDRPVPMMCIRLNQEGGRFHGTHNDQTLHRPAGRYGNSFGREQGLRIMRNECRRFGRIRRTMRRNRGQPVASHHCGRQYKEEKDGQLTFACHNSRYGVDDSNFNWKKNGFLNVPTLNFGVGTFCAKAIV